MPENKEDRTILSRRQFLKDAGLIVGGATVGSMALINACGGTKTVTAPGSTSTKTVTATITQPGGTGVVTTTVTSPAVTKVVETAPAGFLSLMVNGQNYIIKAEPDWSLAFVLRQKLGLFGLKVGCDRAECGSCTIIVDGRAVYACAMLACEAEGRDILTIEGISTGETLHAVQKSFKDNDAFQCGYCTPGNIMSAVALLKKTPKPSLDQVKEAISGNLCWCGDYTRIANAILKAGG